ncbi:putative redox protein, regulator of disulfide bond formation [Hoeflea sp. IMCC20628]|uniref:bifunctional alpha/beta hydrolase/OsmC family protein n=1 Tax=Hoeflea sp. IMCC20628 TaxID=1620421 RepID=UPI00063AD184|nr:bifunctional alpha/beta hydrolase/OsmC family protein [Hoeflea sp. IMCC20628]AKI01197.1 putative redox protein, regulator of disulfide bond formation [Hoeflea sp. IMCC20628]
MTAHTIKAEFDGHSGAKLAARLDLPAGSIRAWALFAHCFTCSKDTLAARRISGELARAGIAVMRFDFTGLGSSGGEFASTNFSSNIEDLRAAADWLAVHYDAPEILVGHSLGGAAVLAIAGDLKSVKAVVTIGAPAEASHVIENFGGHLDEINAKGEAAVNLGGRPFTIQRQFVEDLNATSLAERIGHMKTALLVLHGPRDQVVGIDNAAAIFTAAKHPKSFVSLDDADHMLSNAADANYAAGIIASWAARYLPAEAQRRDDQPVEAVIVGETGQGKFQVSVQAGPHRLLADEPASVGGSDTGPSPYDLMAAGLGACTAMTLRMYARLKKIDLGLVTVTVRHNKVHAADCLECTESERGNGGKIDRFERFISIDGGTPAALADKIVEIANKCPVHRTLEHGAKVVTTVE